MAVLAPAVGSPVTGAGFALTLSPESLASWADTGKLTFTLSGQAPFPTAYKLLRLVLSGLLHGTGAQLGHHPEQLDDQHWQVTLKASRFHMPGLTHKEVSWKNQA
jgi:hypothetical protein